MQLIRRRRRAWGTSGSVPGLTHLLEVELDLLPGARPFRHAPSRLGDVGNEIVRRTVAELEAAHIIRKSVSPWASRLVLVSKKSGEPRCCVDLRDLNQRLVVVDTPLPRCDDAITRLGSAVSKRRPTGDVDPGGPGTPP